MSFKLNAEEERALEEELAKMKQEAKEELARLKAEFSELLAQARACEDPFEVRSMQAKVFTPQFAREIDKRAETDIFALKVRTILTLMMTELNKRSKPEMASMIDEIVKQMMGSEESVPGMKVNDDGSVEIPMAVMPTNILMEMLAETDKFRAKWVRDDIRNDRHIPLYAWVNHATRERAKRRAEERRRTAN